MAEGLDRIVFDSGIQDDPEPVRTDDSDISESEFNQAEDDAPGKLMQAMHNGPQTGPKGVMADYRQHKRLEGEKEERKMVEFMKKLNWASSQAPEQNNQEESDIDSDDEFFQQYRESRIRQIHSRSSKPRFGTVQRINSDQYIEAIDSETTNIPVVIHLYDHRYLECKRMNDCLDRIATRYVHAKFLKIPSVEADPDFDPIALPAILAYKNGELIANLIRVTEELGDRFDEEAVEALLVKNFVLCEQDM
ncbi:thioredoxin-like protein [Basidiobolus meristosporus CBS 931.73]|uniref:Thioredoxin-like protein n=1 Tax=Basidiobolus meristosporus CBS 931.73 TaxID=1314790 RepID=A0A1Y1ZDG4_9FUNG|nr:thioredoxin-like protein [Basidiobolus meristosporus CBS 931.73]|eukprot:ORY08278.1 thioredoxin-like protein [Basidiobolus meristosporus CBS 931.73]